MKENGLRTREMDEDMRCFPMAILTKATTREEEHTEKESTLGRMEKYTMANGNKAWRVAMVFGRAQTENHTLASGKTQRLKAMECMYGEMVTNTKENGRDASEMGMVVISSPTEMSSLVNIKMASQKALVSTSG